MNEPIKDKAPKPPGLLPKNVQSWVIVGIAALMVMIMWLTGGKKPLTAGKAAALNVPAPAPIEVNETKVAELQNRIQELQRQQLAAQSALAQQTRLVGSSLQEQMAAAGGAPSSAPPAATAEDAIRTERRKRDYLSLFASNIALSYRKNPPMSTATEGDTQQEHSSDTKNREATQVAQLLKRLQPPSVPPQLPNPQPNLTGSATNSEQSPQEANRPVASPDARNAAAGKTYVLFEGTVLETVLISRLEGQFSGPVECLLATDVYSHDRQHLLIPAGAKVLGETKKVDTFGQTRLAVVFHRLIMPDGFSVSLDQFKDSTRLATPA
jgi:type IV secretion system protein TrbI